VAPGRRCEHCEMERAGKCAASQPGASGCRVELMIYVVASRATRQPARSADSQIPIPTRTIAATAVMGLVTEAMRKIVSRFTGAGWPNLIVAERLHMHVIMTADERNEAGHLLTFDVPGQHLMHWLEP
jgi:hypothetical protein